MGFYHILKESSHLLYTAHKMCHLPCKVATMVTNLRWEVKFSRDDLMSREVTFSKEFNLIIFHFQ